MTCDTCSTAVSKCAVDGVMSLWNGLLTDKLSVVCVHISVITVLAGASLPWSSGKMVTSQAAKGHDNVLTVWHCKPLSLNEDLS